MTEYGPMDVMEMPGGSAQTAAVNSFVYARFARCHSLSAANGGSRDFLARLNGATRPDQREFGDGMAAHECSAANVVSPGIALMTEWRKIGVSLRRPATFRMPSPLAGTIWPAPVSDGLVP